MDKEELGKEAEEYADWFWGASPSVMRALAEAYIKGAEPREKRIAELEKENAELTCQVKRNFYCYSCAKATERCFRKEIGCPCGKYKPYKEELTKAKEIIESIIRVTWGEGWNYSLDWKVKAEQFLNSEAGK